MPATTSVHSVMRLAASSDKEAQAAVACEALSCRLLGCDEYIYVGKTLSLSPSNTEHSVAINSRRARQGDTRRV